MKFFRGHAFIRVCMMAINTLTLKGARLLGWARFQASILQGARSSKGARFSGFNLLGGTILNFNRQKKEELSVKLSLFGNSCLNV